MFIRIRGKGASPENSQAAVMHIRGFRHTHCPPPVDSYHSVLHVSSSAASTSSTDAAVTNAAESAAPLTATVHAFRFALFPVGVHAATLTAAQARHMKLSTSANPSADASCGTVSGTAFSSSIALDGELAWMLWREMWNLFDILYDEVPLLPWVEVADSGAEAAAIMVEAVERELRAVALVSAAGGNTPELRSLPSMEDITHRFRLASSLTGNRRVVVCPPYCAPSPLPENSFCGIGAQRLPASAEPRPTLSAVSMEGPVVVLDLADLPIALAGGKAMVNIAWYTAFAAMQPDSVLLRCRAVVVRLPYPSLPTYTQAYSCSLSSTSPCGAQPTIADAFCEMVDFIGEHIAALFHGMVLSLKATVPDLAAKCPVAPPVTVVGSTPAALRNCLHSLSGCFPPTSAEQLNDTSVFVFYGDHLRAAVVSSLSATSSHSGAQDYTANMVAQYKSIGEESGRPFAFEMVLVPVKVLLDGEAEPWDEYTLRERGRPHFCPCCGDCNDSTGGHTHVHGHGHCHDE